MGGSDLVAGAECCTGLPRSKIGSPFCVSADFYLKRHRGARNEHQSWCSVAVAHSTSSSAMAATTANHHDRSAIGAHVQPAHLGRAICTCIGGRCLDRARASGSVINCWVNALSSLGRPIETRYRPWLLGKRLHLLSDALLPPFRWHRAGKTRIAKLPQPWHSKGSPDRALQEVRSGPA